MFQILGKGNKQVEAYFHSRDKILEDTQTIHQWLIDKLKYSPRANRMQGR